MYRLPRDVDVSFLLGRKLIQICVNRQQTIFRFDENVSIMVESPVTIRDADNHVHCYEDNTAIDKYVLSLLDADVISAVPQESGELTIIFDKGQELRLVDDSEKYESYRISWRNGVITV